MLLKFSNTKILSLISKRFCAVREQRITGRNACYAGYKILKALDTKHKFSSFVKLRGGRVQNTNGEIAPGVSISVGDRFPRGLTLEIIES